MYKFLSKNGVTIAFLVGLAVTAIFLIIAMSGSAGFNALPKETKYSTNIFDFGIIATQALLYLAIGAAIVFGLLQMFSNLKGSIRILIGIAVLAVLFGVAYSMSSGTAEPYIANSVDKMGGLSSGILKFIGGGIGVTAILLFIAAVGAIIFEVINFFK